MKKILLIENNKGTLEQTKRVLEHANNVVFLVQNIDEGVISAEKENPDLIICDTDTPVCGAGRIQDQFSKTTKTSQIPIYFLNPICKDYHYRS